MEVPVSEYRIFCAALYDKFIEVEFSGKSPSSKPDVWERRVIYNGVKRYATEVYFGASHVYFKKLLPAESVKKGHVKVHSTKLAKALRYIINDGSVNPNETDSDWESTAKALLKTFLGRKKMKDNNVPETFWEFRAAHKIVMDFFRCLHECELEEAWTFLTDDLKRNELWSSCIDSFKHTFLFCEVEQPKIYKYIFSYEYPAQVIELHLKYSERRYLLNLATLIWKIKTDSVFVRQNKEKLDVLNEKSLMFYRRPLKKLSSWDINNFNFQTFLICQCLHIKSWIRELDVPRNDFSKTEYITTVVTLSYENNGWMINDFSHLKYLMPTRNA